MIRQFLELQTGSEKLKYIFKKGLIEGVPNSMISADYYILMAIIKTCYTAVEDQKLASAAAYFTIFYSLFLHNVNYAIIDTLGILGSKDIGASNFNFAALRLKQSLFVGYVLFIILNVVPSFFYSDILINYLHVESNFAEASREMVMWALPAMSVRILTDFLKTFLQNYKVTQKLGYLYMILMVIFLPLVYLVINVLEMGEIGVGLILLAFELSGLLVCLNLMSDFLGTVRLDFSLSVWNQLGYFLSNFLSNFMIDYPASLVYEFQYLILILAVSNSHLLAFSSIATFGMCFYYASFGFSVEPRTIINRLLGAKMYQEAADVLKVFRDFFFWFGIIIASFFSGMVWAFEVLGFFGSEGNELRGIVSVAKWALLMRWGCQFQVYGLQVPIMKSMGCPKIAVYFYSLPYLCIDTTGFITGIYMGSGAVGVIWSESFLFFCVANVLKCYLREDIFLDKVEEVMDGHEKAAKSENE